MDCEYNVRALCVTLNYADISGGTTKSVSNFAKALSADVLSFTSESLIPSARHGSGITHIPISDSLLGRLYGLPLSHQIRRATQLARSYDVIICHMLFRYHNEWVARLGKPYYIVPHGSLDPYVFGYRRLRKELWLSTIGARAFRRAEAVIFATRREQQKAFRGIGSDKAKVICWPVPKDVGEGLGRAEVRRNLGIVENDKVLLFIGRLHSMKRPVETIEAFAQANQDGIHLVIVGPEEQYTVSELQSAAMKCGARNVHIQGPVFGDAKWDLYRAADCYISLSARENFGYTVAEAMSAGLPVILSPGNDLGHELVGQECGWMLGTDERDEAVHAIRIFGDLNPEALKRMGERGKRWITANASFERFQSQLLELISAPHVNRIDLR
jgi:glycosyltransferase involved in cell wall biosynthesis